MGVWVVREIGSHCRCEGGEGELESCDLVRGEGVWCCACVCVCVCVCARVTTVRQCISICQLWFCFASVCTHLNGGIYLHDSFPWYHLVP